MTIENNVIIDIRQKLNRARKDRQREDWVMMRFLTGTPPGVEFSGVFITKYRAWQFPS